VSWLRVGGEQWKRALIILQYPLRALRGREDLRTREIKEKEEEKREIGKLAANQAHAIVLTHPSVSVRFAPLAGREIWHIPGKNPFGEYGEESPPFGIW